MKLNLYFIRDYLHEKIVFSSIHTEKHTGALEGALIYVPSIQTDPAYLYIMDAQSWCENADRLHEGAFLICGFDDSCPGSSDLEYLGLSDEIRPEVLLYSVQEIFRMFQKWDRGLYELLGREADLREFGDITFPFVNNPICLYSAGLQIIFFSESKKQGDFQLFADTKEMEFLTDEEIEGLRLNPDFLHTIDAVNPEIFPDEFWGYRILYDNLRSNGIYIARLMICEVTRPIQPSDYAILRHLAEIVRIVIERRGINMNNHPKGFDDQIGRLIERLPVSDTQLADVLRHFGWKTDNQYFCALIPVSEYDKAISTVTTFCTKLESLFSHSTAIIRESHIFLLVNLTLATADRETILSHLVYLLREYLMKAGISRTFSDLWLLADYYSQAETALLLGSRFDPMLWIYRYENYAYRHLLHNALGQSSITSVIPDSLAKLIEYDHLHNRQYTRSLQIYLEQNMSMTQAVRKLYMQRSTFVYQLKRIREISGINLHDKNERIHLLFIFELLEKEGFQLP